MNLLSSLLKYTADQIAALRAKNTSQDTTVSGIDTRLGTAETKITNVEAQLATAISAVTVDSEVQNVRVGDDNVTYTSAGVAVRTQFSHVKADLKATSGQSVISFTSGGFIRTSGTSVDITSVETNAGYQYAVIDCSAGDKFIINGDGASGGRLWCFIDSSSPAVPITRAAGSVVGTNLVITAPTGASKLVLNRATYGSNTHDCLIGDNLINLINENKAKIDLAVTPFWSINGISNSHGKIGSSTNRIATRHFFRVDEIDNIVVANGAKLALRYYSDSYESSFVSASNFATGEVLLSPPINGNYVRFVVGYIDDATVSSASALAAYITINSIGTRTNETAVEKLQDSQNEWSRLLEPKWIIGGISSSTGTVTGETNRITDETFYPIDEIESIIVPSDAKAVVRYYSNSYRDSYLGTEDVMLTGTVIEPNFASAKYIRIVAGYADDATVTDALAVGNKIKILCRNPIKHMLIKAEIGNYSTGNGGQIANASAARIIGMMQNYGKLYVNITNDYTYGIRYFDENKKLVKSVGWISGSGVVIDRAEARYIYVSLKKSDGTDMTDSDIRTIEKNITILHVGDYEDENKYRIELTSPVMIQNLGDNEPNSLTLCSVKFKNAQNKQPVPIGWLFRNNEEPFTFYWSSDGQTIKELFVWDKTVTDNGLRTPHEYAIDVTYEGDIICVYHGDMAYNQGITPYRQNPIVYPHGDYEHPVMVDFGADPAPTAWLQNTGVCVENGVVYIAEYTRFGHPYAYVWKVSAPYTAKANWSVIKQFQVSGNQQGFKHCHNIERDPYSDILYLTTGDVPPTDPQYVGTPGIYYSEDNGSTWTTLLEDSEKYCRQLNFIWTEDYVYWASDTSDAYDHWFIRAKRDADGIIDVDSIEDIFMFITGGATYNICYCEKPHGILCLDRNDGANTQPLNVHFWNIDEEKLYIMGIVEAMGAGFTGFRVEAMNHYPSANNDGFLCGFGCCQNNNKMVGNKYSGAQNSTGYAPSASDNIGLLNNVLVKIVPN